MKQIILIILIILFNLSAQYEWSTPIQLSEDGNYPATTNSFPAITVDSNGVIYAFWVRGIETADPYQWNDHIEFRKSYDGGLTWTETENITPENTESRLYRINAACDTQNNIHIIYKAESTMTYYKKYNGIGWSNQAEVYYCNNGTGLKLKIDSKDRIYAIMWSPSQTYYAYHEASDLNNSNWTVSCISAYENMYMYDFTYDTDNNLHAVGSYYSFELSSSRPFYMKYDRSRERWGTMHLMDYIGEDSRATTIVLTGTGIFQANVRYGDVSHLDNENYLYEKAITDTLWLNTGYINSYSTGNKKVIIDQCDSLHFFEGNNDGYNNISLIYTYKKDGTWVSEYLHESDDLNDFGSLNVAFNNNDRLYIVYERYLKENNYNYVYFQSKQVETGIDDSELTVPVTAKLYQNYPNPFNNETVISFSIPEPSEIQLNIYNIKGESVDKLISKKMNIGIHSVNFKANVLNSGIYYYQLTVNGKIVQTKSMLYLK